MREIKYRGLRVKGGFAYGLLSRDLPNSTAYYDECSYRICWHPESGGQANIPVQNGTIGQYTGLKDKNGKEIYEGDIVKTFGFDKERNGEIYFQPTRLNWSVKHSAFTNQDMFVYSRPDFSIEVIGNIYENPELIES